MARAKIKKNVLTTILIWKQETIVNDPSTSEALNGADTSSNEIENLCLSLIILRDP